MRRAISTFIFDEGIFTDSCNALFALRMRLSMSAMGSVSISSLLPARLCHARNYALVRQLAQADPAEAELLEHGPRTPAAIAPRVVPHLELLLLLLLYNERLPRHLLIPPVVA